MRCKRTIPFLLFFLVLSARTPLAAAPQQAGETYDQLLDTIRVVQRAEKTGSPDWLKAAWTAGKQIDSALLKQSALAGPLIHQLAQDLNDDVTRLYYLLQFARAYPDGPPEIDLPWGYYQYFLAINDARERETLARRAASEKWNWDKMRAEVKKASEDNKDYVFTATPGKTQVYRVLKATRGPYRGKLVLDLGFGTYYKLPKTKFEHYDLVWAKCKKDGSSCVFKSAAGQETNLFTYKADVSHVIDGDTFIAVMDLGFGLTSTQTLRLWGTNAAERNTPKGRKAKQLAEKILAGGPVLIRAMKNEKYGRYLADVWGRSQTGEWIYLNQELIRHGYAVAEKR